MDEGLCGLLSIRAVPLQEKAPLSLAVQGNGVWRSKSSSGPTPVCGKGLHAALVFARAPRGSGSLPPRSRPPRAPQHTAAQANGLEALLGVAESGASGSWTLPRPPALPEARDGRPPLPRSQDPLAAPPKASLATGPPQIAWARSDGDTRKEVSRPVLPPLPVRPVAAEDAADEDVVSEGCTAEAEDIEGHSAFMDSGAVCSAILAGSEEVLVLNEDMPDFSPREDGLLSARDEADEDNESIAAADLDDTMPNQEEGTTNQDEAAQSDESSEASAEVEDAPGRQAEVDGDDKGNGAAPVQANGEVAPQATEASEKTSSVKKKKKKKRKKKRRTLSKQVVEEEPVCVKRPAVPRFPHPPKCEGDFLPVAATTIPITDHSPAILNMKERLSKHLLLGRFQRRPLASLLGEGLEEGAARTGGNKETGGELTSMAAAESLGLLETSNSSSSWSRPRRSQSHDGSAARAKRGDAGMDSVEDQAGQHGGSKASNADPKHSDTSRRNRARSEGRHRDGADDGLDGPLSIVGQKPKPVAKNKLSAGSKQWLAAAAAEQKKQMQESGDAALSSLYFSFSSMKDADGNKVVLKNREKIVRILHELNTKVAIPISRHYGLRYNFFSEHHCQAKKAGVTVKDPLILRKQNADGEVTEETRHLVTIRLRIRIHPTKGDPQTQFMTRGTQLAVLLHELCHLKHMNHGKDFMLFLRDIFAQAVKLGVFDPKEMSNEIPSPWPWENEIFKRGGDVSNEELMALFLEHKAAQREKAKAAEEAARKDASEADAGKAATDAAIAEAQNEGDTNEEQKAESEVPAVSEVTSANAGESAAASAAATADVLPPPPPAGATQTRKQKVKAFLSKPAESIDLSGAFGKGSHGEQCDCCAELAGPTSINYGEEGELETSTETSSPSRYVPPPRRSRSLSRGRSGQDSREHLTSLSRASSVVKLPQLSTSASPPPRSPHLASPSRGRHASGVPTLPPV